MAIAICLGYFLLALAIMWKPLRDNWPCSYEEWKRTTINATATDEGRLSYLL